MVQVKRGQRLTVEIDEKWYHSTVVGVDCSMVQLYFPVLNRYEWIYRGSTRLGPLYLGVNTSAVPTNKFSKFQKRNVPSIEYITIEDDENEDSNVYAAYVKPDTTHFANLKQDPQGTQHRATARKSTANRTNHNTVGAISLNRSTIYIDCDVDRSFGTTVKFTTKNYRGPLKFVKHECSTECLYNNTKVLRSYNLLSRPLIVGWERHLCSAQNQKKEVVVYRAPCGRRLRSMYEVHRFLRQTNCSLSVEHFDFDPVIRVLATYKSENCIFETPDISFGKEIMPIQCVNNYDDKTPPPCDYSAERIPTEGVNLNLDKEFLCGCDCEDDCFDKRKCQCFQLTMKGVKSQNPKANIDEVGYVYKRLMEPVITGIYECNVQCKCNKNKCLNRVVQHPLQTKLQVFNTKNKGWGIRCLNDVPKGSFICIYAGQLLTEEASNRICINDKTGDEYFADLDFIETMENLKEGYETEAYRSEEEYDEPSNTYESDVSEESTENMTITSTQDSDEEYTSKIKPTNMAVKTRSQLKKNSTTQHYTPSVEDENDERECVGLIPNSQMDNNDALGPEDGKIVKLRSLFGKNEQMCVLDAKKSGNLGRYFNVSTSVYYSFNS
ncbi:histone-lysine N-methyltransferase eggless-like [Anopheles nili]|uniref:histone-lysine N-methyltransferase eggless-like n=1 Tax=Anopheles nili TaxID=185578 RepID=UPI00237AC064|nr:histone-lysine N-methyltransferase eggless-like [Anopheles nili]